MEIEIQTEPNQTENKANKIEFENVPELPIVMNQKKIFNGKYVLFDLNWEFIHINSSENKIKLVQKNSVENMVCCLLWFIFFLTFRID